MLTIRPFDYSDADYRRAIAIEAAVFNEPAVRLEEWKHEDQVRDKSYPHYRDVVERDGVAIGFFETFQNPFAYHPHKYTCYIFVHPAHDATDVRPAVLEHVLERLADQEIIALQSGMLDDKPEAMRFFADYDFEPIAEEKLSKLDVGRFDPARYHDLLDRVRGSGIEIMSLRELQQRDPDWQTNLYDLDVTVNRDIPATGDKHYPEFDDWVAMRLHGPAFDPDAWFVALDGWTYVAHSHGSINRESDPVQFDTGVTTVRREYRRRGIATALKVYVIRFAHDSGVQEIFTTNDATNPMYDLNVKLGFQPLPSWRRVEKQLAAQ